MFKRKLYPGLVAVLATVTLGLPAVGLAATTDVAEGSLIKLSCTGQTDNSCRTVYYVGIGGSRHPFPNQEVYFSWYTSFDDIILVDQDYLNTLPVGKTVTLKPGTAVLKFQTSDAIYAVAEGGILRHYLTPELVAADYGSDWAQNDLVIMPDALFGDYVVGEQIDSALDYDPTEAENGVISIDDNF